MHAGRAHGNATVTTTNLSRSGNDCSDAALDGENYGACIQISTFHLKAQLTSLRVKFQRAVIAKKGLLQARRLFGRAAMASKELLGIPDAPPGLLLLGQQQTEHRSRPHIGPVAESSSEYLLLFSCYHVPPKIYGH
jgi:hypothetical protein